MFDFPHGVPLACGFTTATSNSCGKAKDVETRMVPANSSGLREGVARVRSTKETIVTGASARMAFSLVKPYLAARSCQIIAGATDGIAGGLHRR